MPIGAMAKIGSVKTRLTRKRLRMSADHVLHVHAGAVAHLVRHFITGGRGAGLPVISVVPVRGRRGTRMRRRHHGAVGDADVAGDALAAAVKAAGFDRLPDGLGVGARLVVGYRRRGRGGVHVDRDHARQGLQPLLDREEVEHRDQATDLERRASHGASPPGRLIGALCAERTRGPGHMYLISARFMFLLTLCSRRPRSSTSAG